MLFEVGVVLVGVVIVGVVIVGVVIVGVVMMREIRKNWTLIQVTYKNQSLTDSVLSPKQHDIYHGDPPCPDVPRPRYDVYRPFQMSPGPV